jgi:hypothetical protein
MLQVTLTSEPSIQMPKAQTLKNKFNLLKTGNAPKGF